MMDNENFAIFNTKIILGIKFHINYFFFAKRIIKNFTFVFPIEMRGIRLCSELLSILLLIRLFLTNLHIATDLCPRMTCLYPLASRISVRD